MPLARRDSSLDQAFLSVWRQALVDRSKRVVLAGESYSVRKTAKRGLAQVDFMVSGASYRGLEQNPATKSRWAELARNGARVMQFLSAGQYLAVVSNGKLTHYGSKTPHSAEGRH